MQMGRTFSFSRSNSANSSTSGTSVRIAAGGSQADSAASTPRGSEDGGGTYNPYTSSSTLAALVHEAEKKAEANMAARLEALREEREQLAALNTQLTDELEATRAAASELHSRASVAEDSRSAASSVRFLSGEEGRHPFGAACSPMDLYIETHVLQTPVLAALRAWYSCPCSLNLPAPVHPRGCRPC